jgi:DNA-binding NtrC family response regulator
VLSAILKEERYTVCEAMDYNGALSVVTRDDIDVVITDMKMPDRDGMQLFDYLSENHPDIPVIFLTAYGTVDSAVHAITQGAFYYFIKPPDYAKLKGILARALEQRLLKREIESLKSRLGIDEQEGRIIGKATELVKIFETINAVKDSISSVLICGETGTGKELIARSLHYQSTRKRKPFVAVNCAAMPSGLLESELFGYEKGAFTGATARRIGRFEEAADGTVFLDEIGELELQLQAKLLRVLQEKEIERLGSNRKVPVNFRLISSTNRDLAQEIKAGHFREDLYYRINVVNIKVPPLRERKDDIPLLTAEFVKEYCARERKSLQVSSEVMDIMQHYEWPGNIRQLRNIIERAAVLARGKTITVRDLPDELRIQTVRKVREDSIVRPLREIELEAVRAALMEVKGNKSKAAELLGISRKALYKRLKEIG